MEEAIQIIVFCIIILSVIISKYKEVNANRPGQSVQKSILPDYTEELFEDEFTEEEEEMHDLKESDRYKEELNKISEEKIEKITCQTSRFRDAKPQSEILSTQTLIKPTIKKNKESRIRITTRKEARKAFIYSEIFNRKYE